MGPSLLRRAWARPHLVIATILASFVVPTEARADDEIEDGLGMAGVAVGGAFSGTTAGPGAGVSVLGGIRSEVITEKESFSTHLAGDAMFGGGSDVFAQRLRLAVLPGVRIGDRASGFLRVGADLRYDRLAHFSIRHFGLPRAELGFHWTSARGKGPLRADHVTPREPLLGGIANTIDFINHISREPGSVSLDVAAVGGLSLGGAWRLTALDDGTRASIPGGATVMSPAGSVGMMATVAIDIVQLRGEALRFVGPSTVDEMRGGVCLMTFLIGACAEGILLRSPVVGPASDDEAMSAAGMLSVGLFFGGVLSRDR